MRRISVDKIITGMRLSKSINLIDGRMLLSKGMPLKESYIDKLKNLGIYQVYIDDEISSDLHVDDVISEETRFHARVQVKKLMEDISSSGAIDLCPIGDTVNTIIDELIYNKNIMVNLDDVRSVDDYTFSHSVNVCVLSIITGINLGYNQTRIKEMGMGALLHDIGKTKVSNEIIKKPGFLHPVEMEEMKKHAEYGHEILKSFPEIGYTSRFVVLAHHERCDGSGYPLGLKGEETHEFVKVVAVADVFDALTSDRIYRRRVERQEAVEYLTSMSGKLFDCDIVKAFIRSVPVYPIGTIVELSTGQKAIVLDNNRDFPTRPRVRIIEDEKRNRVQKCDVIDLLKINNITVLRECRDI
ncbi:MAG: Metal-dependent phosphohydrolase [Firmicutes bacterium]|nr:Metal-dependent phosphohydrolase [Bacillota bacterium]MDI6704851.1 HD-GYP domain-containing protein [Bacillota bacterium]